MTTHRDAAAAWLQSVDPLHAISVIRTHFEGCEWLIRRIGSAARNGTFHDSPTLADQVARLMRSHPAAFQ